MSAQIDLMAPLLSRPHKFQSIDEMTDFFDSVGKLANLSGSDVWRLYTDFSTSYLESYSGSFGWMHKQSQSFRGANLLPDNILKGVLNVIAKEEEARRNGQTLTTGKFNKNPNRLPAHHSGMQLNFAVAAHAERIVKVVLGVTYVFKLDSPGPKSQYYGMTFITGGVPEEDYHNYTSLTLPKVGHIGKKTNEIVFNGEFARDRKNLMIAFLTDCGEPMTDDGLNHPTPNPITPASVKPKNKPKPSQPPAAPKPKPEKKESPADIRAAVRARYGM